MIYYLNIKEYHGPQLRFNVQHKKDLEQNKKILLYDIMILINQLQKYVVNG